MQFGFNKSEKDSTSTGESIAYYFSDNTGKGKFLPKELQFRYVGKFPVATDTIIIIQKKIGKVILHLTVIL